MLGHELRNPLAPAPTALELMKVRDPKAFTREREVLELVTLAHMARLVNDLLDVSRLALGKYSWTGGDSSCATQSIARSTWRVR